MKKIFITGISGFIGRELAATLRRGGFIVSGTVYGACAPQGFACDLRDADAIRELLLRERPDAIIHLAALSSVTAGKTLEYYSTNVVGTENLFAAVDSLNARSRLIFVSTAGVYGNQKVEVLSEDLMPLPVSHYGLSKYVCERMAMLMADRHDVTIVRPFNVIGAGQNGDFLLPKLVHHFLSKADQISLGNLAPVRDYIDVASCCDILAKLLVCSASFGETVNLCSGRGVSVQSMVDALTEITGHQLNVVTSAQFIRKNEVWRLLGSTEKLRKLLPDLQPPPSIHDVLENWFASVHVS